MGQASSRLCFFYTISDKASAVPGFISGHGEADIHARAPDNLGEHENPQRDVEHQEREQAYRHDTNHAAAVLSAYRLAAVDGYAGKAESISEDGGHKDLLDKNSLVICILQDTATCVAPIYVFSGHSFFRNHSNVLARNGIKRLANSDNRENNNCTSIQ